MAQYTTRCIISLHLFTARCLFQVNVRFVFSFGWLKTNYDQIRIIFGLATRRFFYFNSNQRDFFFCYWEVFQYSKPYNNVLGINLFIMKNKKKILLWLTNKIFINSILICVGIRDFGNPIPLVMQSVFRIQLWIINSGLRSSAYKIKSIRCYSMNLQVMRYSVGANSICFGDGVWSRNLVYELIYHTFGCKYWQ